ncbi:glycosyl transferase [Nocardia sp. NPDC050697]|uniref:glycosyl transferase n=1 Tax=Nocardia sp. NPDC050697 TaxID=3155158 RepID=UPI0033C84FC1
MRQAQDVAAETIGGAPAPRTRRFPRRHRANLAVDAGYLALACTVLSGQWRDTGSGYLVKSGQDQTMWEWFFAVTAHSVAHLENPLGTDLQNFPAGVNLMANTAMFGVGVPLTPVTLLFGPTVTFVLVLTAGLAGTAYAWYRLFAAELTESRGAAILGGLCCGFAPAMISHANAHPNFVVLPLLPVLAGLLIRLGRGRAGGVRWRAAGVLGLLVTAQIALGEEPLLVFALAFGLFGLVYHLHDRRGGLRALRALTPTVLAAAALTLLLCAVPLWWQFFGPQSYRSIDHGPMGNDLKALTQFPSESLGGVLSPGQSVAINPTEQNAYFGWPLLLFAAVAAALLWRERAVRGAVAVIAVFGVLSLGSEVMLGKQPTGITGPWRWAEEVPLLSTVLESRLTMAAVPAIAVILVRACTRMGARARADSSDPRPAFFLLGLVAALLPLIPTVLPVVHREPTPRIFAEHLIDPYLHGGSVVVIPPPRPADARALRWQADAGFGFPLADGYFVGPTGADRKGSYGPPARPTAALLIEAQRTGRVPAVDAATRERALADLRYWRADVLVLPVGGTGTDVLRGTTALLVGAEPVRVADAWVWDVRAVGAAAGGL